MPQKRLLPHVNKALALLLSINGSQSNSSFFYSSFSDHLSPRCDCRRGPRDAATAEGRVPLPLMGNVHSEILK